MLGKVILDVIAGPLKGKTYTFEEHDTFIFGRKSDCHARLSEQDTTVSRHHFLFEVNPPNARIQDLGSRNGTYVNGVKYGGRPGHMTPEEARGLFQPVVDIKDGDEIKVGVTIFNVRVESPVVCYECGTVMPSEDVKLSQWEEGLFVCRDCRERVEKEGFKTKLSAFARCNGCGKDVSAEVGHGRSRNYICEDCRAAMKANPAELLRIMMRHVGGQDEASFGCLNDYKLSDKLGEGGMGAVYLARRKKDGATVAVKMMLAQVAVDDYSRKLFEREVNVTSSLGHPNIVTFFGHCSLENLFSFIMEYCAGGSLWDLMRDRGRPLPLAEAGRIILQALDGLAYIHDRDFVHRDLKPQNILLTEKEGGVAKISDFGLAKNFEMAGLSGMTISGAVAGTIAFMPCEQLINFKYCKPVSDVWSIGATLYFMLTGQTPRDYPPGKSPQEVAVRSESVPVWKRSQAIPKNIAEVIDRAVSRNTEDRYGTAAEFRDALVKVL